MTGQYATTTSVSVERTEAEIKTTLRKYGATSIAVLDAETVVQIAAEMNGRRVLFRLPLPDPKDQRFTHRRDARSHQLKARTPELALKEWEQACRSSWRSLLLVIKATLEAIAAGIIDFDTAMLPYIMLGDGRTVAEHVSGELDVAASGHGPLMLGPGR